MIATADSETLLSDCVDTTGWQATLIKRRAAAIQPKSLFAIPWRAMITHGWAARYRSSTTQHRRTAPTRQDIYARVLIPASRLMVTRHNTNSCTGLMLLISTAEYMTLTGLGPGCHNRQRNRAHQESRLKPAPIRLPEKVSRWSAAMFLNIFYLVHFRCSHASNRLRCHEKR